MTLGGVKVQAPDLRPAGETVKVGLEGAGARQRGM